MIRRRRTATWGPADAASSLAQLAFLERALAHILSGWAVKMPTFEAKLAFGLQMHRSMERATALRSRVNGLCYATAEEANVATGWRSLMAHIDRAQTPARLLSAVYRWFYRQLVSAYETHLQQTDPVGDRASIELIRSFLPSLKAEWREGLSLRPANPRVDNRIWFRDLDDRWTERNDGEPLALQDALWSPVDRVPAAVRPNGLEFTQPGSLGVLAADPLNDPRDVGMFLHKELDEEYTTLELIARNSYEHPDMPWAFHQAMVRQASDEARHAMIINRLMTARGFRHGHFPVSTSSYDSLYEFDACAPGSRKELLWRMLIRQTFEEGLAIDNLPYEIERRRAAGQEDIATGLEYILRDEVFHARSGLHWSKELVGPEPGAMLREREQAIQHFSRRAEAAREEWAIDNPDAALGELVAVQAGRESRGGKLPDRPLNRTGRTQAGFAAEDIDQVVSWGYATNAPSKTVKSS
jgi:uncharacterized ferritin-like protein (DUF455 family)